jgi:hypothetical protein
MDDARGDVLSAAGVPRWAAAAERHERHEQEPNRRGGERSHAAQRPELHGQIIFDSVREASRRDLTVSARKSRIDPRCGARTA